MQIEFDFTNGGKALVVGNVVTILGAIATGVWSVATLQTTVQDIDRRSLQNAREVRELQRRGERIKALEQRMNVVEENIDDLEGEADAQSTDLRSSAARDRLRFRGAGRALGSQADLPRLRPGASAPRD